MLTKKSIFLKSKKKIVKRNRVTVRIIKECPVSESPFFSLTPSHLHPEKRFDRLGGHMLL
jgi:hypothetical protein